MIRMFFIIPISCHMVSKEDYFMATPLRPATLDDLGTLVPLLEKYRDFYNCPQSTVESISAYASFCLGNPASKIFLAFRDTMAVGFTQLYRTYTTLGMGHIWILNDLFVLQQHRNHGMGTQLIEKALAFARVDGARRVDLKTGQENQKAAKLYTKLGFKKDQQFMHLSRVLTP